MEMMNRINTYWSRRAEEFSDARRLDLDGPLRGVWTECIREYLPKKQPFLPDFCNQAGGLKLHQ